MLDRKEEDDKQLIPKVIHYCWFGKGAMPELAVRCMESWRTYLPEYKLVRWDEESFDINSNLYVKEAYEARKFAFVTDYVRLYALYTHGGIYMDTDVEVIKPLDCFLHHEAFSGFETLKTIPTGILGAAKDSDFIKELLSYYDNRSFYKKDGTMDITTNVRIITGYCVSQGFKPNNEFQLFRGFAIYPKAFFCPLDWSPDKSGISTKPIPEETYVIHYFAGSWLTEKEIKRSKSFMWKYFGRYIGFALQVMKFIIGEAAYKKIKKISEIG